MFRQLQKDRRSCVTNVCSMLMIMTVKFTKKVSSLADWSRLRRTVLHHCVPPVAQRPSVVPNSEATGPGSREQEGYVLAGDGKNPRDGRRVQGSLENQVAAGEGLGLGRSRIWRTYRGSSSISSQVHFFFPPTGLTIVHRPKQSRQKISWR